MDGRTIALYGDSGSGKTTQIGELAKWHFKRDRRTTRLYSADLGGFDSINPLIKLGVIEVITYKEGDDPWLWVNGAVSGPVPDGVALMAFDSATSNSEALLSDCARLSAAGQDIGGRPAPKFIIGKGSNNQLKLGTNVDSHYLAVQNFMLESIWKSTWLARGGVDVVWTFSVHRGEKADDTPVLGPKLAGKALTAAIPKWFKYTFRIVSIPVLDSTPRHVLYLQEQPDISGSVSFGNSRYPLDATSELPATIEPASLIHALEAIEVGQEEAENALRMELGL